MQYFATLAYQQVLGLPLVIWGGLLTISLLILTALIGFLIMRGIVRIQMRVHVALAIATVIVALMHGTLVFLSRL
jgi:hypothetical protein